MFLVDFYFCTPLHLVVVCSLLPLSCVQRKRKSEGDSQSVSLMLWFATENYRKARHQHYSVCKNKKNRNSNWWWHRRMTRETQAMKKEKRCDDHTWSPTTCRWAIFPLFSLKVEVMLLSCQTIDRLLDWMMIMLMMRWDGHTRQWRPCQQTIAN